MAITYYYRSLDEIRSKIINNIREAIPNADTKEGTFISNVFVNPVADQFAALYGDMEILHQNQSIIFATGDDLDLLAANYFVTRKPATIATGKVRFYIANSNKPASEIDDTDIPPVIHIPVGTVLSTQGTYFNEPISVQTTELLYYPRDTIKILPIDSETGYRYLECAAESVNAGEINNIAAGTLIHMNSSIVGVSSITNPFAFNGGTDRESDASLTYRVQLAITGNNIGTKDGYLKFVLEYNNVSAAKVVGAGDNIMFRDGGFVDAAGKYHWGSGGCVDIYVKGHQVVDDTYLFTVTPTYVKTYPNILLPNQPVVDIISISSEISGETLINAANYDSERYSYTNGESIVFETHYCVDILWDFSLTDSFPDTDYYSLPLGFTSSQIARLKLQVDNELLDAKNYMTNMSYFIDWAITSTRNTSEGSTTLFNKIYVNDSVYKLVAKDDANLDGRVFVMKNNSIYVRAYVEPDYILQKDTSDYAGGMVGEDSIRWLSTRKLLPNDMLTIVYNYDNLINTIQMDIEEQKCMTANVLVKQAVEVPIEIIVDVDMYNTTTPENVRNIISTDISTYIASTFTLGGTLDRSDIVALIKSCRYIDRVDLDTMQLSRKGRASEDHITIADNEYFTLSNLVLNITVNDTVIA